MYTKYVMYTVCDGRAKRSFCGKKVQGGNGTKCWKGTLLYEILKKREVMKKAVKEHTIPLSSKVLV